MPEIEHVHEPFVCVGELPFVDEQAGLRVARLHGVEDAVERQSSVRKPAAECHPEHEERGRQTPRHCDLDVAELVERQVSARDDDRSVAGADRRTVGQQRVAVLHERIRGERQRGHLELPFERPFVQHLDVFRHELELEFPRVDASRHEAPGHERVVGVCGMADADAHGGTSLDCGVVAKPALTEAIQDYLRAIYKLGEEGGSVSVTALAKRLSVSPASASAMVKKLSALELAAHQPYRGHRADRGR